MRRKKVLMLLGSISLTLVLTTLLLPACAAAPAPTPAVTVAPVTEEVIEWKFQSTGPLDSAGTIAQQWWADWIYENTNGRLKVTIFPVGQLVKSLDILDALRDNVIQMGIMFGGYYKEFMPEAGLAAGFPMNFRNSSDMREVYWMRGFGDLLGEAYAEHGVYFLSPASYGQVAIWATKPLRTLDDFKGLKIRAVGEMTVMLKDMGAAVTYIPHEESFMALQLGTIDAYSTGLGIIYKTMKHYEVAPYVMTPPVLALGIDTYGASIEALNELPEDLRILVKTTGPLLDYVQTWLAESGDALVLGAEDELGFELIPMSDEVIKTMTLAGVSFLDDYATKSDRSAKMVAIIKVFMKDRGYID